MPCMNVLKVEQTDNFYRFHLGCSDPEVLLGYIDMDVNEIDPTKVNDPMFQKIIMRNYIHRRKQNN